MSGALSNHLWQSTWFAVAVALMTVALRRNRAQVRYWLWFIASFKFFVPFSLLINFGSYLAWAPAARKIATPTVSTAMVQITEPFPTLRLTPSTEGTADWIPIVIFAVWAAGFAGIVLLRLRDWLRIRAALRSSTAINIPATVEVRSSPGLLEPGVVGVLRPILLLPRASQSV